MSPEEMAAKLKAMAAELQKMMENDDMWGALSDKLFVAGEAVGDALKRAEDPMMS